ncbi:MAG: TldD/PmbA family protein [candidate division Zixibacteria bacterium]|nr:TldD/PmbA family protein [candidate division Zixibacteria bacterium]
MTRRDFVRVGAQGLALAAIPVVFRVNPAAAFSVPAGGDTRLSTFLDHFSVSETDIRQVMGVALERGGDFCDLFFEHRITNWVGLEDEAVNQAYSTIDLGLGIRVLEGDQSGFSFTEELTLQAMKRAARTASRIAKETANAAPEKLAFAETPDYHVIKQPWEQVGIDQKIPYLQKINSNIHSLDKRIIKSRLWFGDQTSYCMIATSDGLIVCDYRPMTQIAASCTAEQGNQREKNGFSLSGRQDLNFYSQVNIDRIAKEAVGRTVRLFDAVKPEAGEMEVVLAAGNSGILLHEAIGHGMEADFNRKGISIFADKINKKVAEDFVSIVDDGTCEHARGSLNVDDEGNNTEKTFLVENGILKSYLHDNISAKHYGVTPTGNGRRQSFRYPPMPRMRCTYMLPGPHTKDEIIASCKKGIYAESFNNGEVHIGAGDFTFYVNSGNLIENGKLTAPIKDINIIGNGPEVLRNIVMVGDDPRLAEGGGMCGKNGQGVPTSMGLPTAKVSAITVGGVSS